MPEIIVVACRIFCCSMWDLVPWPGIKPGQGPLHREPGVLATGPPGKSLTAHCLKVWISWVNSQFKKMKLRKEAPSKVPIDTEDSSLWPSLWQEVKPRDPELQRMPPTEGADWGLDSKQILAFPTHPCIDLLWRERQTDTPSSPTGLFITGRPRAQKTKASQPLQRAPWWNFCFWQHTPSTSWWSLGEEALTQTRHIFCGLVVVVGALGYVSVSLELRGWKSPLTLCTFTCGLPQAMHSLLPAGGGPGRRVLFSFLKKIEQVLILVYKCRYTHIWLYVFSLNLLNSSSKLPSCGLMGSSLAPSTTWAQAGPGSGEEP